MTTHQPQSADTAADRILMAEYAIADEGRSYFFGGYHYDRLADAVAYAKLMRSRPAAHEWRGSGTQRERSEAPTGADKQLMESMSIRFEGGYFRFRTFRYDRLADAVNYALLLRLRQDDLEAGAPIPAI